MKLGSTHSPSPSIWREGYGARGPLAFLIPASLALVVMAMDLVLLGPTEDGKSYAPWLTPRLVAYTGLVYWAVYACAWQRADVLTLIAALVTAVAVWSANEGVRYLCGRGTATNVVQWLLAISPCLVLATRRASLTRRTCVVAGLSWAAMAAFSFCFVRFVDDVFFFDRDIFNVRLLVASVIIWVVGISLQSVGVCLLSWLQSGVTRWSVALAVVLIAVWYYNWGAYLAASASFDWGGPFPKKAATILLASRATERDVDRLEKALIEDDWQPGSFTVGNWRELAVQVVKEKRGSARVSQVLAQALLRCESPSLATRGLRYFVPHREQSVIPLLVRFGLEESYRGLEFDLFRSGYIEALWEMDVREALILLAVYRTAVYHQRQGLQLDRIDVVDKLLAADDIPFGKRARERIRRDTGVEPGPTVSSFTSQYLNGEFGSTTWLSDEVKGQIAKELSSLLVGA